MVSGRCVDALEFLSALILIARESFSSKLKELLGLFDCEDGCRITKLEVRRMVLTSATGFSKITQSAPTSTAVLERLAEGLFFTALNPALAEHTNHSIVPKYRARKLQSSKMHNPHETGLTVPQLTRSLRDNPFVVALLCKHGTIRAEAVLERVKKRLSQSRRKATKSTAYDQLRPQSASYPYGARGRLSANSLLSLRNPTSTHDKHGKPKIEGIGWFSEQGFSVVPPNPSLQNSLAKSSGDRGSILSSSTTNLHAPQAPKQLVSSASAPVLGLAEDPEDDQEPSTPPALPSPSPFSFPTRLRPSTVSDLQSRKKRPTLGSRPQTAGNAPWNAWKLKPKKLNPIAKLPINSEHFVPEVVKRKNRLRKMATQEGTWKPGRFQFKKNRDKAIYAKQLFDSFDKTSKGLATVT